MKLRDAAACGRILSIVSGEQRGDLGILIFEVKGGLGHDKVRYRWTTERWKCANQLKAHASCHELREKFHVVNNHAQLRYNRQARKTFKGIAVMCSVTWPLSRSEAGGDLVLIQTSVFLVQMWTS